MNARSHALQIVLLSLGLAACAVQDDESDTQRPRCEEAQGECQSGVEPTAPEGANTLPTSTAAPAPEETGAAAVESDAPAPETAARVFGVGTSCTPTSCRNSGTCVEQWLGFTCICPAGFTGSLCETASGGGGSTSFNCGALTVPNGRVNTPSGTRLGATATYVCNSGFTLSGSGTRTCQSSGWSGTAPVCTSGPRCGDGIVTRPAETCDPAAFGQDPWRCDPKTCQTTTMYTACRTESECSGGQNCINFGCTFGCTMASQCPAPPAGRQAACAGGFACTVACSSTSQCPSGLVCDSSLRVCGACNPGGTPCPWFTSCRMYEMGGRCE